MGKQTKEEWLANADKVAPEAEAQLVKVQTPKEFVEWWDRWTWDLGHRRCKLIARKVYGLNGATTEA